MFGLNKTQKLYILSRKLTFKGHGSITFKHGERAFTGSQNLDSLGDMIESYGHLVKNSDLLRDHSSLPVRADVKESIIFTIVPTLEQNWVATVNSLFNLQKSAEENKNPKVSNSEELPLPEGYPEDVVPISSIAFLAISETISNENNKNEFNFTLKVNQTKRILFYNTKICLKIAQLLK